MFLNIAWSHEFTEKVAINAISFIHSVNVEVGGSGERASFVSVQKTIHNYVHLSVLMHFHVKKAENNLTTK